MSHQVGKLTWWLFDNLKKEVGAMTKLGYTVDVQDVVCEFGKSTGWQAVMKIYTENGVREIPNTIWSDKFSAMHDRDEMAANPDVWINM